MPEDTHSAPSVYGSGSASYEPRGGANHQRQRGSRGRGSGGRGSGGRGRGSGRGESRGGRGGLPQWDLPSPKHRPLPMPGFNHLPMKNEYMRDLPETSTNNHDSVPTATATTNTPEDEDADDVEAEVCFICASPVVHQSLAPCNHRTCHICSLRLRALYKSRACAHCRQEAKYVIFTDDNVRHFEEFQSSDFDSTDDVLGIKYDQKEIREDTILLLRYNCPESTCDVACFGWPDLHRHVRSVHHKVMCDLCTRNKKVFTHEHELFTQQELKKHERYGDDNPGSVDQSGFRGHPLCGFCNQRFYGDDELYSHLRDKHEKCHVCERMNPGKPPQYYLNYEELAKHFRKDHFMCPDNECLEKKFVVFGSEMDLKAHQLEQHPDGLSKDARRDARRVDISAFDYRQPHQAEQPRRRGGRGRDPNTEPLPASSAQPMRRDEIAFARQMAIQSAQSVTTRTFGGALTSTDAYAARPSTTTEPASQTAPRGGAPPQTTLPIRESQPQPQSQSILPPTNDPRELARRMQHQSVMDRSLALLKNNESKFADFRSQISSFRNGTLSAEQLIDVFFTLFDVPSSDLGKLIKELADIFEIESKRADLLSAWSDWRAINEDYPVLPGPSGALPTHPSTNVSGRRILKLKSSTSQSAAAAPLANRKPASWTSVGNPHVSRGVPGHFPSLPVGAAARSSGNVGPVPWAGSAPRPVATSTPKPVRQSAPTGADAFPALPAAMKPNTLMAGIHRGTVRWDDSRGRPAPANPWGGASAAAEQDDVVDEPQAGGKKKGRKGKQVLYAFG